MTAAPGQASEHPSAGVAVTAASPRPRRRIGSYLIIYNPTAGNGGSARAALAINNLLVQAGLESRIQPTSTRGDAERIATEAIVGNAGRDPVCVVACGGDGTVQEAANAVAKTRPGRSLLGIAPAGRCNDFARALGLGGNAERIAAVLTSGRPKAVDLGRVGDRYFCTIAAVGFDAAVSRYVNDMRMPLRGSTAYVYGTLRMLPAYHTPTLRLTGDFGSYEGPVFLVASANTPWYGGAMKIAPQADPFDGKVDICLVTKIKRRRVLAMLSRVGSGRHTQLPEVRMLRSRSLTAELVDPHEEVQVWADGEPLDRLPATIESVPQAVEVMLP